MKKLINFQIWFGDFMVFLQFEDKVGFGWWIGNV